METGPLCSEVLTLMEAERGEGPWGQGKMEAPKQDQGKG